MTWYRKADFCCFALKTKSYERLCVMLKSARITHNLHMYMWMQRNKQAAIIQNQLFGLRNLMRFIEKFPSLMQRRRCVSAMVLHNFHFPESVISAQFIHHFSICICWCTLLLFMFYISRENVCILIFHSIRSFEREMNSARNEQQVFNFPNSFLR